MSRLMPSVKTKGTGKRTTHHTPLLSRRRRLTPSVKREIRRLWRTREYDTMQLANMLGLSEAAVYGAIACRVEPTREMAPPIPRYAGYDPTERL